METEFRERIEFKGNLDVLSKVICEEFHLGKFENYNLIPVGYEDFNMSLKASKGMFFVKIFAKQKSLEECKRNIKILVKSLEKGVSTPKLYELKKGYLLVKKISGSTLRICVADFINGEDYFSSGAKIEIKDQLSIVRQVALINSVKIKPLKTYDSWAAVNFKKEFRKKCKYLDMVDLKLMTLLLEKYDKLHLETLPHCLVHGDIIRTNVIKDKNGKIWIIDFSVANYYPRIQELAVLGVDVLFDKDSKKDSEQNFKRALAEYTKLVKLTRRELNALPTYVALAHAMHVLSANYEKKVKNNNSKENNYFLKLGKSGLRQHFTR